MQAISDATHTITVVLMIFQKHPYPSTLICIIYVLVLCIVYHRKDLLVRLLNEHGHLFVFTS